MRIESIVASILIIISLFHPDIPSYLVWIIPSVILASVIGFGFMFSTLNRHIHISIVCISCIIAGVTDDPIVDIWLRISGVVVCILFSVLLYNSIDKGCTLDFKNECFKGVLADLSLLGIIPAALDLYFGWLSIGAGISLFLTLVYSFYLLYEPKNSYVAATYAATNLTDNGEQQRLFGSINDDKI